MRVGLILVGVGHMGLRALLLINWLSDYLRRNHGINFHLLAIAEPGERARTVAATVADGLQATARIFTSLRGPEGPHLLAWLRDEGYLDRLQRRDTQLLVYDASPAEYHFAHILHAHPLDIHYLGEKPLVLSPHHQQLLDSLHISYWCDFIELESLTYHALNRFIHTDVTFTPKEIRFWRLGSTALKKLADPQARRGVQGGSLEDKAPHDLALTLALLGGPARVERVEIDSAAALSYVPASRQDLESGSGLFMDHRGNKIDALKRTVIDPPGEYGDPYYAADAEFRFSTRWLLRSGESVACHYATSWVGAESFVEEIDALLVPLSIARDHWLGQTTETRGDVTYQVQEVRIAVLRGQHAGREIALVGNFLLDLGKDFRNPNLVPWIKVSYNGEPASSIETPPLEFGTNSLARILRQVILDICNQQKAICLNESAARIVNNTLIKAREHALRPYANLREDELTRVASEKFTSDKARFLKFFTSPCTR